MKILKIEFSKNLADQFYIYVWIPDAYRWTESPFAFKYKDGHVYFLAGGQDTEKNRRLAGNASNEKEAIEKATTFLQWWLKECQAVGILEILDVVYKETNSGLIFSLWVAHRGLAHLKKGPFTFSVQNDEMFFLSGETEASQIPIEYIESREEAISRAKDFLEWWLDEGIRVGQNRWPVEQPRE